LSDVLVVGYRVTLVGTHVFDGVDVELFDPLLRFDRLSLDLEEFVLMTETLLLELFSGGTQLEEVGDHLSGCCAVMKLLFG
jgi:hypothetical protein